MGIEDSKGSTHMNAVQIENELMDPGTYWFMHCYEWRAAADVAADNHYPATSDFYRELEDAAGYIIDLFGLNH